MLSVSRPMRFPVLGGLKLQAPPSMVPICQFSYATIRVCMCAHSHSTSGILDALWFAVSWKDVYEPLLFLAWPLSPLMTQKVF